MPVTPRSRRIIRNAALGLFGAQCAAAGTLMAVDAVRKQRANPPEFPLSETMEAHAGDDQLSVYGYGAPLFDDMIEAIESAQHSVYFETFIWKADPVGQRFKDALIAAAERGVDVHVVYDVFANLVVDPRFFRMPDTVHVKRHPLFQSAAFWRLRNTGRDHRKLLVVDSRVAFVGGFNIGARYSHDWRDTHARVIGPTVAELENAFVAYWNLRPAHLLPNLPSWKPSTKPELPAVKNRNWQGQIAIQRNTPRWAVYPIRNMYLEAIDRAERNIWLTTAYLIPDEDFRTALGRAVDRGVDVRIIVPAESNHVVADWLSRGFYSGMLRDGIHLYLFRGAMVHAKTATIDGVWSTIGTANLDRLSLLGNYEVNAEIRSHEVAAVLERLFLTDQSNCTELELEHWESRSLLAKATEILLAPWRPLF
ncbi:cardiolipin synthase [Propionibacterium cyclohexanicum]|uniref:Cardiolipin synthase n=1 Tax=Propionibacterium cyclohexanicum TaxID=64702 RepID=A0A1H9QI71_9ACTN|nr:phospholipase D-like domain-containing protein [Propionibacterium cyclohexanicum]SER60117.1 cardiolipin synthase [Propionibacterium cyclohexanicum]